jgi:hypothetical protein
MSFVETLNSVVLYFLFFPFNAPTGLLEWKDVSVLGAEDEESHTAKSNHLYTTAYA